jgi:hypothetical protein
MAQGMTQAQLAAEPGIDPNTPARMLAGRILSVLGAALALSASAVADPSTTAAPQPAPSRLPAIVLGVWLPPKPAEAEFARYADCGFNVVMAADSSTWRAEDFALARKYKLAVIVNMTWGPPRDEQGTTSLEALLAKWKDEPNFAGVWIADDCENPGKREADWIALMRRERPDLLALICQDRPNGKALREAGAFVQWDMVYSFKEPEREIGRLCRQSAENGLRPWVIVNIEFKDKTLDFGWVRSTMLHAKEKGVKGFWYFTTDPDEFDGKHDLSGMKQLNALLLR